jgi:hypothetical protein
MGLKGRFEESKIDDDHVLATRPTTRSPWWPATRSRRAPSTPCSRSTSGCATTTSSRLPGRRRSLEQAPREGRRARRACACRTRASTARSGCSPRRHVEPRRARAHRGRVGLATHPAWLPSDGDRAYVRSLMGRVTEPGRTPTGSRRPPEASTTGQPTSSTCASADYTRRAMTTMLATAPHRPRDLHPLQHLRGGVPARRRSPTTGATTSCRSSSATSAATACPPAPRAPSTRGAGCSSPTPRASSSAGTACPPTWARPSRSPAGDVPDDVAAHRGRGEPRPGGRGASALGRPRTRTWDSTRPSAQRSPGWRAPTG